MHGACFALHKVLVLHCDKQCKVFYHLSCLLIAEFIFTAYFVGGALLSVHVLHAHIYKRAGNNRRCCGICALQIFKLLLSLLAKAALLLFLLHRIPMQLYSPCTVQCKVMPALGHVAIFHLLAHTAIATVWLHAHVYVPLAYT